MSPERRRIRRLESGRYAVRIPMFERRVLAGLREALGRTLDSARGGAAGVPELLRLFPPAYPYDNDAERSYQEMMHNELFEHHRAGLAVLEETANARELDEEQIAAWLGALNDVRLVLGTTLGVNEDDDPVLSTSDDRGRYSLYIYLSMIVTEIVEALEGDLPEVPVEPDYLLPEDPWGDPPDGLRWSTPGAPLVQGSGRVPGPPAWLVEAGADGEGAATPQPPGVEPRGGQSSTGETG